MTNDNTAFVDTRKHGDFPEEETLYIFPEFQLNWLTPHPIREIGEYAFKDVKHAYYNGSAAKFPYSYYTGGRPGWGARNLN